MACALDSEVGPESTRNGITSSMLLSSNSNLLEIDTITNEIVLELARFKDLHPSCTLKSLYSWLKDLFGAKWPEKEEPTSHAVAKSIERLRAQLSNLKKRHTSAQKDQLIAEFLQQDFLLPRLGLCSGRIVHFSPAKSSARTRPDLTQEKCILQYKELKKKIYSINRNANKRLKRRELLIKQQKSKIQSKDQTLKNYEKKIVKANSQLSELRSKLNRVNHRASYWKQRVQDVKSESSAKKTVLHREVESLKEEISSLHLDNAEMNERIESILTENITTFEAGKYTDDVRACIYELLSLNVGVRNVSQIIRCVLGNIMHKSVERLPSHGLTCQMILESLTVAQAQLGEKLSEIDGCCTLQTDGTTKFGEHFGTYDVKNPEDDFTYHLGLRHVFSGSAQDTLETLKEILDDIDDVQLAIGKSTKSAEIVSKIKNTMSDRHAAEKLFNEILSDFRAEILPTVIDNWDSITEVEREQLTRMNNFFCGLHFMVGLADAAEETLKLWEAQSSSTVVGSSSGTQRLVRTACKALHHRGSQQCGSSTLFRTYLRKEGIHRIPLAQFVGNRFFDAAGVYYLRVLITKYIETVHGGNANRLLQCVLADLRNPMYIAGCRALGLVDKMVTGPLWRKIQESSISILELGNTYCRMKEKFDKWSENSEEVIEGSAVLEQNMILHVDEIWDALLKSNESDVMTQEVLQLVFRAFSRTCQRLLVDHLPGGVYHSVVDPVIIQETASVPVTNVSPERDFAVLDRMLREKPNARIIALEAMVLYSHNKSAIWLDQQSCEARKKLFQAARTLAPAIKEKFEARRLQIEARREVALLKKQEELARKLLKKVQDKEKLTKEIEKIGLWMNRFEVEAGLDSMTRKAEKVKALKLQINFRSKVLEQSYPDNSVFKFSSNRKQFSVHQLQQNLLKLLTQSEDDHQRPSLEEIMQHPELLIGQRIRHRFSVNHRLVWYEGTVTAMISSTEFQVDYDDEDDTSCFPLLEDLKNGDIMIL